MIEIMIDVFVEIWVAITEVFIGKKSKDKGDKK